MTHIKFLITGSLTFILLFAGPTPSLSGQSKVYPPHWFTGLQNDTLELLLYRPEGIKQAPALKQEGPQVLNSQVAPNEQYAYLLLSLEDFKGQGFRIQLGDTSLNYELKTPHPHQTAGLSPADALYLITPDRFANGDTLNDRLPGFQEEKYGREKPFGRHGGDLAGIRQHLDYIDTLGFSTLWISPLLTNDQPHESYHGYAITDHFRIDPRFGSNAQYQALVNELHQRDMKMVMDVVYNHVGDQHPLFQNPPDSSFFHFFPQFRKTQYRASTLSDPHASQHDKVTFSQGWFDHHMPDLNQRNPHLARYLIQQSLWWILEYGLDGFRIDTYAYPDQAFMSRLAQRIHQERPQFFLFGELWVHMPEIQSYFSHPQPHNPINSHLDGLTDFTGYYALLEALNQPQSWTGGITKLYYRLAADYLYQSPDSLITFLDNHDLARVYGALGQDTAKLKVALGLLYTLRGIPCTYYGTEALLAQTSNHGLIREDFPGGWPRDTLNLFDPTQHRGAQKTIWNYLQGLLQWRRTSPAITQGQFTHFLPQENVYAYLRHHPQDTVLVLVNAHPEEKRRVALSRFRELWPQGSAAISRPQGRPFSAKSITLPPMSIRILQKQ